MMLLHRVVIALLAAGLVLARPDAAQAQAACLTGEEMREAVGAGHAISAMVASRAARGAVAGEIVRVRLCRQNDHLVYRVTLLHRDGRVGHVTIDGSSGKVAEVR